MHVCKHLSFFFLWFYLGFYGIISEARVMWDQSTGKSRGFGFVAFRERADAEQAIATMNGEWLGSRAIRCNWANQKNTGAAATPATGQPGSAPYCMYCLFFFLFIVNNTHPLNVWIFDRSITSN